MTAPPQAQLATEQMIESEWDLPVPHHIACPDPAVLHGLALTAATLAAGALCYLALGPLWGYGVWVVGLVGFWGWALGTCGEEGE